MSVDDKYTVSLLHFDDGIKDESGKLWTNHGATVDTTQKKFGASSLCLNGSSYVVGPTTNDFNFGLNDYTIDFWYNFKAVSLDQYIMDWSTAGNTLALEYYKGKLKYLINDGAFGVQETYTPSIGQWEHVAIVRSGTTIYLFSNGNLLASGASSLAHGSSTGSIILGAEGGSLSYNFNGYIDEFRVSNVARWTTNFTPPTAPNDGGTTIPSLSAPKNLTATAGDSQVTLAWTAVTGATGYNVKRATIAGGPYTTIASNVSGTSYVDTAVTNGTTYYYVVTAVNADGESANSNEASATPAKQVTPPSSDENVLLQVTMSDSSDREFQLSATEIDDFVNWYNHHESTDMASYSLNKNIGIRGSKEYLAFEKIISFEVMPLTK